MKDFHKKLARGELVLAGGVRTEKLHLVKLLQSKTENRPSEEHNDGHTMWTGIALCGNDGANYYWTPYPATTVNPNDESGRCLRCWQRWRALDKPGVLGWTIGFSAAGADEWQLPAAWHEVEVVGHPHDVPEGGDPTKVLNSAGEPVGKLRTEIRRWQRGARIVRIVKLHGDEARSEYAATYHCEDEPLEESSYYYGTLAECRRYAHKIMASGGYL